MKVPTKHLNTDHLFQNGFTCPCCGYKTFSEPSGSYNICPVCYWEDDPVQLEHPSSEIGANRVSLKQAQQNFIEIGACSPDMRRWVRKPLKDEPKDPNWQQYF
jgi:methionyl-tRNA synthetase